MRIPIFGIIFLLLPILEIAALILVGNSIGLWATLGLLLGTSVLGVIILRANALSMASKLKETMEGNRPPESSYSRSANSSQSKDHEFVGGSMRSIGAILLILPGFICKTVGILFLIPFLQRLMWRLLGQKIAVYRGGGFSSFRYQSYQPPHGSTRSNTGSNVVDLDEDDFERQPNQQSPWYENKNDRDQKRIE